MKRNIKSWVLILILGVTIFFKIYSISKKVIILKNRREIDSKFPKKIKKLYKDEYDVILEDLANLELLESEFKSENRQEVIFYKAKRIIKCGYNDIINNFIELLNTIRGTLNNFLSKNEKTKEIIRNIRNNDYLFNRNYFEIEDPKCKIKFKYEIKDKVQIIQEILSEHYDYLKKLDKYETEKKYKIDCFVMKYLDNGRKLLDNVENKDFDICYSQSQCEIKHLISAFLIIYLYKNLRQEFFKFFQINDSELKNLIKSLFILHILRNKYEHKGLVQAGKDEHEKNIKLSKRFTYKAFDLFAKFPLEKAKPQAM